jgi:hypothetical protein
MYLLVDMKHHVLECFLSFRAIKKAHPTFRESILRKKAFPAIRKPVNSNLKTMSYINTV